MNKFASLSDTFGMKPWVSPNMQRAATNADGYSIVSDLTGTCTNGDVKYAMWSTLLTDYWNLWYGYDASGNSHYSMLVFPTPKIVNNIQVQDGGGTNAYQESRYCSFALYQGTTLVANFVDVTMPRGGGTINVPVNNVVCDRCKVYRASGSDNASYDGGDHQWVGSVIVSGFQP